jgi:8-oxo-dGTP diphosphatase
MRRRLSMNHSPFPIADSPLPIHVVAGVLRDARGRVLLARREGERELAGLWEFPGGKVEPGETAREALARELREEIGVAVEPATPEPLIAVPHCMASGKRIVLDVYRIARFKGRARGLESQALAWVQPERLPGYSMPGADRPVVAALCEPETCLMTPRGDSTGDVLLAWLEQALAADVRRVIVRGRVRALEPVADAMAALAARHGATFLFDSGAFGLEAAMALARRPGLGVSLAAGDLERARSAPPADGVVLTALCESVDTLARAQNAGVSFALVDFPEPDAGRHAPASRLARFAALRETVTIPLYLADHDGGADLATARAHGAQGLALWREDWPA